MLLRPVCLSRIKALKTINLTFTTLRATSADDKLMTFFYFSQKCNLHEMLNPYSGKNKKKYFKILSAEIFT